MPAIGHFLYKNSSNITMKRVWIAKICFSLASVFSTSLAYSQVYFKHKDWEVACDNTGTCRAAGYQAEGEAPVSMLITRFAGAQVSVEVKVKVIDAEGDIVSEKGEIYVQGHRLLSVPYDPDYNPVAVDDDALRFVRALLKANTARVKVGEEERNLSLLGLNAVLLKMDDFQRRVKTKTAFVAVGLSNEQGVMQLVPMPKLRLALIPEQSEQTPDLLASATAAVSPSECPEAKASYQLVRLSESKSLLIRNFCWMNSLGEYSNGFWVVDHSDPKSLQRIGRDVPLQEFRNRQIHGETNSPDGLQACGIRVIYSWDGNEFVKTAASQSELCRGFRGSAWVLHTLSYEVEGIRAVKKKAKKRTAINSIAEVPNNDLAKAKAAAGAAAKAAKEYFETLKENVK